MWKFIEDASVSHKQILITLKNTKNHWKTPYILEVAINYVETYSSSNAAAQDPDKREKLNGILFTIITFNTRKDILVKAKLWIEGFIIIDL